LARRIKCCPKYGVAIVRAAIFHAASNAANESSLQVLLARFGCSARPRHGAKNKIRVALIVAAVPPAGAVLVCIARLRALPTHPTVAALALRAIFIVFALTGDADIVYAALPLRTADAGTADYVGLTAHGTALVTDAANLPHLATDTLAVVAAELRLRAAGLRRTNASLVNSAALPGMLTADL